MQIHVGMLCMLLVTAHGLQGAQVECCALGQGSMATLSMLSMPNSLHTAMIWGSSFSMASPTSKKSSKMMDASTPSICPPECSCQDDSL